MQDFQRYGRAPLTEALIDFRCTLPAGATLETLGALHAAESARYPERLDRFEAQGTFTAGAQVSATASQRHLGYLSWDRERRQAFQARLNGFTFSRLTPYDRWTTFRDEARRLWVLYRDAAGPEGISRVAVRYINRLELPVPLDDFKDFLRTVPEVSPELPQGLSGYLMRLEIPQEDIGATLLLSEALATQTRDDAVPVILDIDLFREFEVPVGDEAAWDYLEQLRVRKNQVFEACITDRTREMIT